MELENNSAPIKSSVVGFQINPDQNTSRSIQLKSSLRISNVGDHINLRKGEPDKKTKKQRLITQSEKWTVRSEYYDPCRQWKCLFSSQNSDSSTNDDFIGTVADVKSSEEKVRNIAKQQIVTKICGYKSQDMKNVLFDPEKFVNLEYVMNLLQMSQMKCFYCKEMVQVLYEHVREPRQWTLDRLENDQGHNKSNVIIACLNCNLRRRCMYHERYVFTKQLNVKLCDNS